MNRSNQYEKGIMFSKPLHVYNSCELKYIYRDFRKIFPKIMAMHNRDVIIYSNVMVNNPLTDTDGVHFFQGNLLVNLLFEDKVWWRTC
jgi:hypothetical protein